MKKIIYLDIIILLITFSFSTLYAYDNMGYTKYNNNKCIPYSEENVKLYEEKAANEIIIFKDNKTIDTDQPSSVEPNDGTVNIITTAPWTSGITYEDGSKYSNILSNIINISLTISSYFTKTVYNIVKDVALSAFGMRWDEVEVSAPGSAKLMHSYSYIDKLGKVWNSSTREWVLKVDVQKRQWYRHEYASFKGKDGYTHSAAVDYIPTLGYGPIYEESKAYFDDNTFISNTARELYLYNRPTYYDVYTYVGY